MVLRFDALCPYDSSPSSERRRVLGGIHRIRKAPALSSVCPKRMESQAEDEITEANRYFHSEHAEMPVHEDRALEMEQTAHFRNGS